MTVIPVQTHRRQEIIDLTPSIHKALAQLKAASGILLVYSPHTTAGITVNENADPSVKADITRHLNKLVPEDASFTHSEGNADAHIKGTLVNFSQSFIVEDGKVQLGTWQGIFFMEFDGPRRREVWVTFTPGQ